MRRSMLAQQAVEDFEDVAFLLRLFAVAVAYALKGDLAAPRAQNHVRPRAQKGVSANLLAALNRLQQKRVWLVRGHAQKG